MKKVIGFLIVLVVLFAGYKFIDSKQAEKREADYAKIETVKSAMTKAVKSDAIVYMDNLSGWTYFDLRIAKEERNAFYKAINKELGADFDTQLTNGEFLFVGVYPKERKFEIHIGDPKQDNSMVYPNWEYKKIKQK